MFCMSCLLLVAGLAAHLQPCTSFTSSGSQGSADKRQKFEMMRKQHYNMKDALLKVGIAAAVHSIICWLGSEAVVGGSLTSVFKILVLCVLHAAACMLVCLDMSVSCCAVSRASVNLLF